MDPTALRRLKSITNTSETPSKFETINNHKIKNSPIC